MWRWCGMLLCGAGLALATSQSSESQYSERSNTARLHTSYPAASSVPTADASPTPDASGFLDMCGVQPTASVSCGTHDSVEHMKDIEVRIIYWLTTRVPFYIQTVQYDVVGHGSTLTTTATQTITNNATGVDMLSYTSLIPTAQVQPSGPYDIYEVDPIYDTTEEIGTATLTYPTPYALILNRIHVHQMGSCANGSTFTTSAWFAQPAPIPLPTTLPYLSMGASVNFTNIPGFDDAFHALHPALAYCTFTAFTGQPSPKVVVDATTAFRTVSAANDLQKPTPTTSPASNAAALSSAALQLGSLASYILCGLGSSCSHTATSSSTLSTHPPVSYVIPPGTGATVATLGASVVPLYTAAAGVVVPVWTTLQPGAPAATVGGAVMSVGTDGAVVVDGGTVGRGVSETGGAARSEGVGRASAGRGAGWWGGGWLGTVVVVMEAVGGL
ncbi:uncharacterized protein BKCO1_25000151 [Diplodia corticola]|uniref:Uncharacterized protein n=1 Tax=Diplodia corticola TaxID=236234 RepID=A0A1J9R0J0_9PEZI|nr:uncharacterized protein BKCO1_25000151 [Diplodia corticola]OJD34144.1 hypothetical protein BKCO1_25000151 [Diplodia corticola]